MRKNKLTSKQERFCQNIIKGMNQSAAYRDAYDTKKMKEATINSEACRLVSDPNISARLEELREKVEAEVVYTVKDSFANLQKAQSLSLARKNALTGTPNPDVKNFLTAEDLKMKLFGLVVDKSETTLKGVNIIVADEKQAALLKKV